ncbi:MAG: 2-C-methyl-D-erythritol 4-phosphate cytidylyltransferase [Verrucomicrobia bacterium]|nr:2-C-methyl-D-erythritol 4-phosphate cytidylyltransferase [Verrucomicrobiota bacterium]
MTRIRKVGIILMGGSGSRFGSSLPKQFHEIVNRKIYLHTLETFQHSGLFDEIILVCHPDWIEEVKNEVSCPVVTGGSTRQESSYLGLIACPQSTDYVVIHDAVRPFVSEDILKANIEAVQVHKAVDTCIPALDTPVISKNGTMIDTIPLRDHYWRGQTPQSFAYELILQAHKKTLRKNVSDDCSLVLEMGHPVFFIHGSEENIKITTEFDLILAQRLFLLKN